MSISDKDLEAILNDEPTQDELDAAAKDFIGRHVMPERTAPLPKPASEEEEDAEFNEDEESDADVSANDIKAAQ